MISVPIPDHPSLRFLFLACAGAPRSPLNATQRAAIWESLRDPDWQPDARALPETTSVVEARKDQRPVPSGALEEEDTPKGDDANGDT